MIEEVQVTAPLDHLEWVEIDGVDCGFRLVPQLPERWECVALVVARPVVDTLAIYAIDELTPEGFRVWHPAANRAAARASAEAALRV